MGRTSDPAQVGTPSTPWAGIVNSIGNTITSLLGKLSIPSDPMNPTGARVMSLSSIPSQASARFGGVAILALFAVGGLLLYQGVRR